MEITPELLEKYGQGNCSKAEIQAVEAWLDDKGGFEKIRDVSGVAPDLEEKIWYRIKTTKSRILRKRKSNVFDMNAWGIAASIAVLMGLGIFLLLFEGQVAYETNAGELKTLVLDDGTTVILNVASTLRVSKDFGSENRGVILSGEAYFEVAEDSLHPFIVETNESMTQVLGTRFNLSAYQGETNTLTLDKGRVLFYEQGNDPDSGILLLSNEQGILDKGKLNKKIVDPARYKAWIQRQLVFEDQSFAAVVRDLERFYGVHIEVKKQGLNGRKYNGTHTNQPLESVLEDMGFVLKFQYRKEGKTVLIY